MKIVFAMAAVIGLCALAADAPAAPKKARKKLLVVTHTTGFRHADSIPIAEKVIAQIGQSNDLFDTDYCRNGDDVKKMLTPEGLKPYSAVFFANTTGNLGIPDLRAFLEWIRKGGAFIGAHSAGDTYHPKDVGGDSSYIDMIGCEFKSHGAQTEVDAIVEDSDHPAVKHFPPVWKVFDEIYIFEKNNRGTVHTLLSMDKHPNDRSPNANKPGDHLLAWCKNYGKGKVFYTALGHRPDVWNNPDYQKHLLGGIKWALGKEKGKADVGTGPVKRP
jgi:type 1 glutamine amidotransferase